MARQRRCRKAGFWLSIVYGDVVKVTPDGGQCRPTADFDEEKMMDSRTKEIRRLCQTVKEDVQHIQRMLVELDKPDPAPKPVGFGEEWKRPGQGDNGIYDARGKLLMATAGLDTHRQADRAIACVNVFAGIRNVAAVGDALCFMRAMGDDVHGVSAVQRSRIASLLSALDQEPADDS